jgi:hypothetical protein
VNKVERKNNSINKAINEVWKQLQPHQGAGEDPAGNPLKRTWRRYLNPDINN